MSTQGHLAVLHHRRLLLTRQLQLVRWISPALASTDLYADVVLSEVFISEIKDLPFIGQGNMQDESSQAGKDLPCWKVLLQKRLHGGIKV